MGYKKGYSAERELRLKLEAAGWTVIRSGGSKKPDLIAGRAGRIMVIECKATANTAYVSAAEIAALEAAAAAFGGTPVLAVKKKSAGWRLVPTHKLRRAGKYFVLP